MLRQPAEIRIRPGAQKSRSTSLPAPIGGLNARDSVANMASQDAVTLENWFPKTTSVDVRNGYTSWSTFTGLCQSVLIYTGLTATKVFPCVKNGSTYSIFDGTSSGALSTAVVGGGGATVQALTSTRFDSANFGTTGGQYFVCVNGADTPLQYDGTTWIVSAMSGMTTSALISVGVFKRRLWFIEKNTFNCWYLPVDSITGALTKLHVGPLFKLGGNLNSIVTVTDSTNGNMEDYIGFLSNQGEVVCFTGTDPSSSTTWTQAAHFRIGRPVTLGNRTWSKWGSDAVVLCADGVYPLRKAIQANAGSGGLTVSDKIRNLLNGDLAIHGGKYGWQVIVHPTGGKLFVNVPTAEDSTSYQYVMNTETGAWCKYTGWTAFHFAVALDTLYYGGSGVMVKADTSAYDGSTLITADCVQAYNYFGSRGNTKQMKMMRPILASDGAFNLGIGTNVDYRDSGVAYLRPVGSGGGDPWAGIWDATWSGSVIAELKWYGVNGVGHAVAPRVKAQTNGTVLSWSATDIVYEVGGVV